MLDLTRAFKRQEYLNARKESLQSRKSLIRLVILKTSWPSKCQKFKVGGSLAKGRPRKTQSEVKGRNLEEWTVSKEQAKDRKV